MDRTFVDKYNNELVEIQRIRGEHMEEYRSYLRGILHDFSETTGSRWGRELNNHFEDYVSKFWLVKPKAADLQQLMANTRTKTE
jgi:glutamate synthase (NADPH/NADH) large chain